MAVNGRLRSARWLRAFQQGPMVTAFRNLESGQVLFSQTLHPQQFYIDQQFKWPNWQNKKPTPRKDIWRPLAIAEMASWQDSVKLYRNLVELRHRRDMYERKQATAWRRKSAEGNTWFANQFRPTYTFEAVADLVSALENNEGNAAAILHWDAAYRKGSDEHWANLASVQHRELPKHNPREQMVVLNDIRQRALKRALEAGVAEREQLEEKRMESELEKLVEHRRHVLHARARAREQLLEQRPDLALLKQRGEAVRNAAVAVKEAKAAFDSYTPRGERGAAKQPIRLREKALRQAKRQFRDLKRRINGRTKKRRVLQPRSRMRL